MLQYIACCKMSIYDITNCQSAQIKNCYWKKNKEITKWLTSMGMWLLPVGNSALHTIWIMYVVTYFCDFLHVQETCGYELARNDCREVNGSSCGKNHLTSIRTFYCPIYCRSIRGQEPSFIRVVKLYGNFLYVSAKYSLRLKI